MKTAALLLVLVPVLTSCVNLAIVHCGPMYSVTLAQRTGQAESERPAQVITCDASEPVASDAR